MEEVAPRPCPAGTAGFGDGEANMGSSGIFPEAVSQLKGTEDFSDVQMRGFVKHLDPGTSKDALVSLALPEFPTIGNLLSWENPAASGSCACADDSAKGSLYIFSSSGGISLPSNTTQTHNHTISNIHCY